MNVSTSRSDIRKKNVYDFFNRYKHAFLMLYMCIYLPWFAFLEDHVTARFHVIHTALDDKIPFVEYFIVPYLLWFFYVAFAVFYFFLKNKEEYYRLCTFLFTGMTVFLIVSTLYPNGHYLRPAVFERENIFTALVTYLYRADTPTNLFPSIHVYNSIGVNIAIWHCENFRENKKIRILSAGLMTSIILSTMFLKQHSVFDVITGIVFAECMYALVYSKSGVRVNSASSLEERVRHV